MCNNVYRVEAWQDNMNYIDELWKDNKLASTRAQQLFEQGYHTKVTVVPVMSKLSTRNSTT